jgi:hypothetical protein
MPRTKAKTADREPEEWARGTEEAADARTNVAEQFTELLADLDRPGSRAHTAARLTLVAEAERSGDPVALRAAVMELSVAAGSWVLALDLARRGRV